MRGDVFRATSVGDEAGGKGVNVARAVAHAGVPVVAVLPADDDDLLVKGLIAAGVHPVNIPVGRPSRVNITVTEPDGTTTKFNDPGHRVLGRRRRARSSAGCWAGRSPDDWVVLSGSLPPDSAERWYGELTAELKTAGRRVAVDTSGAALAATADRRRAPARPAQAQRRGARLADRRRLDRAGGRPGRRCSCGCTRSSTTASAPYCSRSAPREPCSSPPRGPGAPRPLPSLSGAPSVQVTPAWLGTCSLTCVVSRHQNDCARLLPTAQPPLRSMGRRCPVRKI